ncbi:MAG TPA: hypothetical protein VK116_04720, partial [Planctomycetota bacterium]|nr:hypothetical protein [Planctomycetota bacterium]
VAIGVGLGTYDARWPGLVPVLEEGAAEGAGWLERHGVAHLFERTSCSVCGGRRLKPEFLAVRIGGRGIDEIESLVIAQARSFFGDLELGPREGAIAKEVLAELGERLRFLDEVGLGYLALDRPSATLSGGEAQRIRLASQLGNRLTGVLYVLDEPTVGLHPRDTRRLLKSLEELRDQGNTIILVEHDRETMEMADLIIDMGPGAGREGGRVVAAGPPAEIRASDVSMTGLYLRGERLVSPDRPRREPDRGFIELEGVSCHNVRDLDAAFPIGVLTVVAGVSGSGKSTLVLDVLADVVKKAGLGARVASANDGDEGIDAAFAANKREAAKDVDDDEHVSRGDEYRVRAVRGLDGLQGVVIVDQRPVGRTPRATPATFSGAWTPIRELFA